MKMLKNLLILGCMTCVGYSASAQIDPVLEGKLQTIMNNFTASGLDGISTTVLFPNGCSWDGVAGIASPGDSVDLERKWHFASNTKMMTATILFQLHEEGILSIYDSIGTYIQSTDFPYLDGSQTLLQFMNHTSTVTNTYTGNPRSLLWDSIWATRSRVWKPEDGLKAPYALPSTPNPTGEHRYVSLNNFVLLGLAIEGATGNTLSEEFDTRIFGPLNLTKSSLGVNGVDMTELNGLYNGNTHVGGLQHNSYISSRGGAGWLISTPSDVATFLWELHHGNLLEDSSLNLMKAATKGTPSTVPGTCFGFLSSHYGAGTNIMRFTVPNTNDTLTAYGHGGNGLGVVTSFYIPDLELCVVSATNDFTEVYGNISMYTQMLCQIIPTLDNTPCTLGLEDVGVSSASVYPNPTTGRLNMSGIQITEIQSISVVNSLGQTAEYRLLPGDDFSLQIDGAPGVYFMMLNLADREVMRFQVVLVD